MKPSLGTSQRLWIVKEVVLLKSSVEGNDRFKSKLELTVSSCSDKSCNILVIGKSREVGMLLFRV